MKNHSLLNLLSCFINVTIKDIIWDRKSIKTLEEHLTAAIQWLKRAHDQSSDNGVSWGYSLKGAWRESYRETSGYIVETFFEIAQRNKDKDAYDRAIIIGEWLIKIQNTDGSIINSRYGNQGIVFDTGQVLQGLLCMYENTKQKKFLDAANMAGDWLTNIADTNGLWTRNTHNNIPHVYNTRVSWALLRLEDIDSKTNRKEIAKNNLDYAIQRQINGWFEECAFLKNTPPFTHTIAYVIRGLLESGLLLKENIYIETAIKTANKIKEKVKDNGFIPGQIDEKGRNVGNYCCLTGNCQMAIIWLKLFKYTGDQTYFQAAIRSLRYVMSCQNISTINSNIRGGIKGSHPIIGAYTRLSYPNWATKFFIDALFLFLELSEKEIRN